MNEDSYANSNQILKHACQEQAKASMWKAEDEEHSFVEEPTVEVIECKAMFDGTWRKGVSLHCMEVSQQFHQWQANASTTKHWIDLALVVPDGNQNVRPLRDGLLNINVPSVLLALPQQWSQEWKGFPKDHSQRTISNILVVLMMEIASIFPW